MQWQTHNPGSADPQKGTELAHQKHAFINNRTAAHRNYIRIVIALLKLSACNIEHTVKRKTLLNICRFFDKRLHDARHALSCLLSENLRDHRHLPPAKKLKSLFLYDDLKHFLSLCTLDLMLRKEKLRDTVFSLVSKLNSCFLPALLKNLWEI